MDRDKLPSGHPGSGRKSSLSLGGGKVATWAKLHGGPRRPRRNRRRAHYQVLLSGWHVSLAGGPLTKVPEYDSISVIDFR